MRKTYRLIKAWLTRHHPVAYIDRRGNLLRIPRDLLPAALLADEMDPSEGAPTRPEMAWVLGEAGMRQVIEIAVHEADPDIAFLAVVANTQWADETRLATMDADDLFDEDYFDDDEEESR